jgi:hypothetical protein
MPPRKQKIAVIGAGIAGLAAAYTLQKRGFSVQVFEREGTPGGRMRSEQHGEFVIERGAQFIASSYRNMRALAPAGIDDLIERYPTREAVLQGEFVLTDYYGLGALRKSRDLSLPTSFGCWGWPGRSGGTGSGWLLSPERASRLDTVEARRRTWAPVWARSDGLPGGAGVREDVPVLPRTCRAFLLSTLATVLRGLPPAVVRGGNGVLTRTLAERVRCGWERRSSACRSLRRA